MHNVTVILNSLEAGDPKAAEQLLPLVYDQLRRLATHKMSAESPGQTLQPTALVHEAWLRLAGENHSWDSRRHFFSAAAEAMRRILIERARKRHRPKHGGNLDKASFDELDLATATDDEVLLQVHDALDRLAAHDSESAELIKLRFFAGFSNVAAADVLGLSERTAKRSWSYARAWLYTEIRRNW